jgi:geranylgeranyl diphosphate synthase type I
MTQSTTIDTNAMRGAIVDAMRAAFPAASPDVAPFYVQMQYHLGWLDEHGQPAHADNGKLLRPLLVLLSNRALGGTDQQALPLAAGIQLIHDFSLIHDDIEDRSATRRGRRTVWNIWGLEHGINTGDGMFALAHRAVHGLSDHGVPAERVVGILRRWEDTILRICEGQYLDMEGEGSLNVTEDQYLRMIGGKTAALAAASAGLGAQVATDDLEQIDALWQFGQALGMAFQMQDDVLDIWGDPQQTGKARANDLLQRKMSLPVIHSLQHSNAADRAQFVAIYEQPARDDGDIDTLLEILKQTESRAYVEQLVQHEYGRAVHALEAVEPADTAALDALHALARTLLDRER